jgi:hypothetical protein
VNGLTHPRVPLTLPLRGSGLGGGEIADRLADVSPLTVRKQVDEFLSTRMSVLRHVRDAMADSQDKQKEQADARGRGNVDSVEVGDLVLLNAKNLPTHAVSAVFKTKLRPRFVGPFTVVAKKGLAYTLNLPKKMPTHPVFYVGLLKLYRDPEQEGPQGLAPEVAEPQRPAGVSAAGRVDPPAVPSLDQGAADAATKSQESHTTRDAHGARGSHPRWHHSPPQLDRASVHDAPPHGACCSATPPSDPSHRDGQGPCNGVTSNSVVHTS